MITFIPIISFVQAFAFSWLAHPLHVSVTEIEYDEKAKALEIMMRVFMDDLELALRNSRQQPDLDVANPKGATLDQMMAQYLAAHFMIALDGKTQKVNYLGHESGGDVFIFYLEVENVKKWKTINVLNDIIMATHRDQSNLVHVSVRENVRSLRLTENAPSGNLSFDLK